VTVSRLRVAKSETRDLAERDRARIARDFGTVDGAGDRPMSNGRFFAAFVVIAALLTILALVLR